MRKIGTKSGKQKMWVGDVGVFLLIAVEVFICAMVKSRYIGDGHLTFSRESL